MDGCLNSTPPKSVTAEKKPVLPSTEQRKKLLLGVIVMSNLCALSCVSLIAPFFAIEAAKKGVRQTFTGIILSCSEFVIFLASPVIGNLLSRFSPRSFYLAGLWVFGCSHTLFGQLPAGAVFVSSCLAIRLIEALATASILTSSFAIAGQTFPDTIVTVFGILETTISLGFMAGPAIGGGLYQLGGYGLPFWALGVCTFLCGCASYALLHQQPNVQTVQSTSKTIFPLLRSLEVWLALQGIVVSLFAITVIEPVFAEHLQQFNISESVIGVIFATGPGTYSISCMVSASILERNVPAAPVLVTGICCLAIDFLFIGPAPILSFVQSTLWLSILTVGLVGVFTAVVVTSAIKYIFKQARNLGYDNSNSTFGLLSGLIQSSNYFGTFIGPLFGGALTEHYGFAWAMTFSILVIMLPMLLCCTLICFRSRHAWQPSIIKQDNYIALEGK